MSQHPSIEEPTYICPGEAYSISHSVHLARLAAFYPNCTECPHRHDVGVAAHSLAREAAVRSDKVGNPEHRTGRLLVLHGEGLRGVYLNELDRMKAVRIGEVIAAMLCDRIPKVNQSDQTVEEFQHIPTDSDSDLSNRKQGNIRRHEDSGELSFIERLVDGRSSVSSVSEFVKSESLSLDGTIRTRRQGPKVVIGMDERPASPDIVTGIADGLRRMGCRVVDLGQAVASCWRFNVRHLNADGGVFVTGAGCDPSWIGVDIVGADAIPWTQQDLLVELLTRIESVVSRPALISGNQQTFAGVPPYETALSQRFHAIRPLHLGCGSTGRLFSRIVDQLFSRLPCRVTPVPLPLRRRDLQNCDDPDVRRVVSTVVAGGLHLGIIVDDDGQRCRFITERGRLVSPIEIARLLVRFNQHEFRRTDVAITSDMNAELAPWLERHGVVCDAVVDSSTVLATSLTGTPAQLGFSGDGRVWFNESLPVCDALVTLARVMQSLSLSDASFEEVLSRSSSIS